MLKLENRTGFTPNDWGSAERYSAKQGDGDKRERVVMLKLGNRTGFTPNVQ